VEGIPWAYATETQKKEAQSERRKNEAERGFIKAYFTMNEIATDCGYHHRNTHSHMAFEVRGTFSAEKVPSPRRFSAENLLWMYLKSHM
jgi:rRNA maturation protein Nop10